MITRTASGQGHGSNITLCSEAASKQGMLRIQISISDRLGCDSTRVPTRCLPPKVELFTGPFIQAFINNSHPYNHQS